MKRWMVPGLPFALSLLLSLSTVGNHIHWQDSGFYLSAVREMGVRAASQRAIRCARSGRTAHRIYGNM